MSAQNKYNRNQKKAWNKNDSWKSRNSRREYNPCIDKTVLAAIDNSKPYSTSFSAYPPYCTVFVDHLGQEEKTGRAYAEYRVRGDTVFNGKRYLDEVIDPTAVDEEEVSQEEYDSNKYSMLSGSQ